jgi:hypothetical protein
MSDRKWLDGILREAGIDGHAVGWPQNKGEIDEVVRQYVSEQASHGCCSADFEEAGKQIEANEQMRQELTKNLRLLYLKWIDHFEYRKRLGARTRRPR